MLADRGERLDESIGYIKRALQVEPYNGAYLDSLGWAYFRQNKLDLAESHLRKAAEQRLRDSAVQDHFGDLLFKLGRYDEAVAAWQRALDGDGEQIDRAAIDKKIRSAREKAPEAVMRRGAAPACCWRPQCSARAPRARLQLPDRRGRDVPRLRAGPAGSDRRVPRRADALGRAGAFRAAPAARSCAVG